MGAVNKSDVASDNITDNRFHQRIVLAAKHERVDFSRHEWSEIIPRDGAGGLGVNPAFLDERNEQGAGLSSDRGVRQNSFYLFLIRLGLDRSGGADNADPLGLGDRRRSARTRLDNAHDRKVGFPAQRGKSVRGSGGA